MLAAGVGQTVAADTLQKVLGEESPGSIGQSAR